MLGADAGISQWRQGDVCLDIQAIPIVQGEEIVDHATSGVILLSQTCDVVRHYDDRAFVQIGRLAEVAPAILQSIRTYQRPRYAFVPGVADQNLVADLDIVATVDKRDLAGWTRTPGCRTALEQREFGYAVGRHKSRFAFPDPWSAGLAKLRGWIYEKSKKASDEGEFVRSVEQMRILAEDVEQPLSADIICLIGPQHDANQRARWADKMLPAMEAKVDSNWCRSVSIRLATMDELTAAEYLESIRLDFDAMTLRRARP